jgi:hypothetical protein
MLQSVEVAPPLSGEINSEAVGDQVLWVEVIVQCNTRVSFPGLTTDATQGSEEIRWP